MHAHQPNDIQHLRRQIHSYNFYPPQYSTQLTHKTCRNPRHPPSHLRINRLHPSHMYDPVKCITALTHANYLYFTDLAIYLAFAEWRTCSHHSTHQSHPSPPINHHHHHHRLVQLIHTIPTCNLSSRCTHPTSTHHHIHNTQHSPSNQPANTFS